ncbi:TadE/TadG family type IV pilus assembly protein [Protaetiibacter larvae]|uniref:Pilus assembly protein n=1 Tax=Protaetiibacter larvae TaxID=2592654 RepID=A0A5C1Y8P6_9MICO|nr:TadE/TadG family type IV pilus assembly protein [Protaetiibacter larvae]QEO10463.1 pilus assembly protein [Protaetiibacter larvae]
MVAGRLRAALRDDTGSAPVEFVLVGVLLTFLTLAVLQLALALHIRNTVLDAAAEGARFGALADNTPADAGPRTAELISTAIGPDYAREIEVRAGSWMGAPAVIVTVRTTLPLVGLLGADRALEVEGHAARETLD